MDCEHIVKTSTLIIRTLHIDAGCAVTVAVGPVYIYMYTGPTDSYAYMHAVSC